MVDENQQSEQRHIENDDVPSSPMSEVNDAESFGNQLLTMESVNVLMKDLESKESEIAELKETQKRLKVELQNTIDEANELRIRLVSVVAEKDNEIQNLKQLGVQKPDSSPISLSINEKELIEERTRLNISVLTLQKENSLLKQKNLRLGELIMQRDARITTLTKENEQLVGIREQLSTCNIEKEGLQQSISLHKEEAIRHGSELQQEKSISLALRQELSRLRQEKESLEKDYYRVESALQKTNDSLLSYQQQLNDAVMRRNTLAQMVDDGKKEISLLEGKVMDATDRATKIQLDYQEMELQRNHWESLMRSEVERYNLVLKEYNELKESYKNLYVYYMDTKADNDRLQRQCKNLASDAELARASVLTYKGTIYKNDQSTEELLKENAYLTGMLKQKEGQMEEAELYWKKQFDEVLKQATSEENEDILPPTIPPFVPSPADPSKGGYSYPLPSDHPFVQAPLPNPLETPQRATVPAVNQEHAGNNVMNSASSASTSSTSSTSSTLFIQGSLPTQSLSSFSPLSTTAHTSFTSTSFESLLNDVIKQTEELRKITELYESQQ